MGVTNTSAWQIERSEYNALALICGPTRVVVYRFGPMTEAEAVYVDCEGECVCVQLAVGRVTTKAPGTFWMDGETVLQETWPEPPS